MSKKVIAVDIDDVLSQSAAGFAAFSNERWESNITASNYSEKWADAWGITEEEAIKRSVEFHDSDPTASYLHYSDAVTVLKELAERFELVIVTSRREVLRASTDAWLETHFSGIFSAVHYAGMWDGDADMLYKLSATKTELCEAIGADYLIDDQLKHCVSAAEAGIQAVLFGDYSWNTTQSLPKGVTRAHNWQQVKDYFA